MGFEDNFLDRLERKRAPDESPVIRKAHEKAEQLIDEGAINPKDFEDLYGEGNVTTDLEKVRRIKERFVHNETEQTAKVLEAIVYQHTELSNWFGETAETVKTSEFDDIINGIDLVVQFNEDENPAGHLAMGVDVTFSSKSLTEKFDRIKREIDSDILAQVKYFKSHNFMGSLQQIPRVVLGIEMEKVKELATLWINNNKKQLADHPIRAILIREIKEQLETFLKYAEKNGSTNAVRSYKQAIALIGQIKDGRTHRDIEDKVYDGITRELERFK